MSSHDKLSTRPVSMGSNGMVTSAHPLASTAGIKILTQGGNAFDAAVAVASTLNVVEPYMSGIGGIGLALVYIKKENRFRCLNFSGNAPENAVLEKFTPENKSLGILSSLIPGNLSGWLTLNESYGTMDLDNLFSSAINYAENGFPLTYLNSQYIQKSKERISPFPSSSILLNSDKSIPKPGSILKMPQLAESFRKISRHGKDIFYKGELAKQIVDGNNKLGGIFTLDDFSRYSPEWQDPISIDYHGYKILTTPPNSSGFQILETLQILENLMNFSDSPQQINNLHKYIESVKLATTDRIKYAGDPDYVKIPLSGLLSKEYAKIQRKRIDDKPSIVSGEHFSNNIPIGSLLPGSPENYSSGMTTHFAIADKEGNVVSITQTLGGGFGCGAAMGETGIFLNNMASWFDISENSPNKIGPNKKVDFVVAPVHVAKDNQFILSIGTPGSWGILQTTPQIITNILNYGMNIQEAIESPRFKVLSNKHVQMENRFKDDCIKKLMKSGHSVEIIDDWSPIVGGAQGIKLDKENNVFYGGADPRRDGVAIGW